jgi:mannose-6-phosphate isomerase
VVTGDHPVTGDQAAELDRSADVSDLPDPRDDIFTVNRPWGNFQQFVSNERVTVKIITVDPGHRLSLQTHDHRGEFWQVLDVPIEVTVGDRTWSAAPGEAVWVPCHAVHRMANKGDQPGRLLEIAYGDFDEADIVRLQDDYAR